MKIFEIHSQVEGDAPIMFDKFYDQSKTVREPQDKFYLQDGVIVIPASNVKAFFACQRTGCIRTFEGKQWKNFWSPFQSFVRITSPNPLTFVDQKDKPIKFDAFKERTYPFTTNVMVGTGTKMSRNTITRPVKG